MLIIKNSEELKTHLNKYKDLIVPGQDVRIEYQVAEGELRNVECRDLYLMNDTNIFDFNGWDFNGRDFNGWNFNGWDFNGRDFNGGNFNGWDFNGGNFNGWNFNGGNFNGRNFNGRDFNGGNFNGRDFNGWNFNGKEVSYWAFFNCHSSIKCDSIEGRRTPHHPPVSLEGKIEITGTPDTAIKEAIALLKEKGYKIVKE